MPTSAIDVPDVVLAATNTPILTVPVAHEYDIGRMPFTNTSGALASLTVYSARPPKTFSDPESTEISNFALNPGETFDMGPLYLKAGRVISGLCIPGGAITVHVYGQDVS